MASYEDAMGSVHGLNFRFVRNHRVYDAEKIRVMPKARPGVVVRGKFVRASGRLSRKVVVKIEEKWGHDNPAFIQAYAKGKLDYLSRDGLLDGVDENGRVLTLDEAKDKVAGWDGAERCYDVMISPDDARRLDLTQLTARTMDKTRDDLQAREDSKTKPGETRREVQIQYVQYQHWDTEHPHTQLVMSARVGDREVRLSNGYASHGLRTRAEEVSTAMLGYRIERAADLEEDRRLLMERRAERGLDPETGKHPDEAAATESGKGVSKSKEASRDMRGFDGGIE